jgi:predicted O-methyltransferase YrrM
MIRDVLKRFAHGTSLGRVAFRAYIVAGNYRGAALRRPVETLWYVLVDPEITNFTYEIGNYDELSAFLAAALDRGVEEIERYVRELRGDRELAERLSRRLATRADRRHVPLFGRRVGWYCVVRALRPRLVVETGVADGLGSAALLRALERNRAEGFPGRLVGFDLLPDAGWMLDDALRADYELVIEDSKVAMPRVLEDRAVDLFIHDSDHHYEHEQTEYRLVAPHLAPGAVVLSDNAHAVQALEQFSNAEGRRFAFFHERPVRHFYPGGGIGLSTPIAR